MAQRINSGIYRAEFNGKVYEAERAGPMDWLLYQIVDGKREYINDYSSKRIAFEVAESL